MYVYLLQKNVVEIFSSNVAIIFWNDIIIFYPSVNIILSSFYLTNKKYQELK